jgi:hypothetical protein
MYRLTYSVVLKVSLDMTNPLLQLCCAAYGTAQLGC